MEFFATINKIPIHINDNGEGKIVLFFLHGYLETMNIWDDFIDILSKDYRCVSIDLPGHGLSGSNSDEITVGFSCKIVEGVMDLLKIKDLYLIGHSLGGYVAQNAYRFFPDRIKGIICLNSAPYSDNKDKQDQRNREISLIEGGKLVSLAQLAIPNMIYKENLRKLDLKIQEIICDCETHDPAGIIATLKGLIQRSDVVDLFKEKQPNILYIFGDKDPYLTEEISNRIISDFPFAKHLYIANTAHNCFLEAPTQTAIAINDFINK
ncbi:MAG: alpha/beta hydrolase [Bacteroidales bacterium]